MELRQEHQNAHISQQELTDGRSAAPSLELLDHQQLGFLPIGRLDKEMREEEKMATWEKMVMVGRGGGYRRLVQTRSSEKTTTGIVYSVGMSVIFIFHFLFLFCFSFILESIKNRKKIIKNIYIFPGLWKNMREVNIFYFIIILSQKIYKKEKLRMILFIYFSFWLKSFFLFFISHIYFLFFPSNYSWIYLLLFIQTSRKYLFELQPILILSTINLQIYENKVK